MRVAPDPQLSEVVLRRLESLLAEVQPRHALPEPVDFGQRPAGPVPAEREVPPDAELPAERGAGGGPAPPPPTRVVGGAAVASVAGRLLEFGREHLAAVVIVLLVGCGWTAYSLFQARSTPVAVAAVPTVVATPSANPSVAPKVLVHVLGAVRSPGIVALAEGSRVQDAIAAAGGLAPSADPGELNLAAVVADGSQLVIGTRGRPRGEVRAGGGQGGPGAGQAPVSLNAATLEQLDALPGVGPVTARKILDWREQHGRFNSVSELQEVDGIGPKTYAELARNVRL